MARYSGCSTENEKFARASGTPAADSRSQQPFTSVSSSVSSSAWAISQSATLSTRVDETVVVMSSPSTH
jgi:hypothetical protein